MLCIIDRLILSYLCLSVNGTDIHNPLIFFYVRLRHMQIIGYALHGTTAQIKQIADHNGD